MRTLALLTAAFLAFCASVASAQTVNVYFIPDNRNGTSHETAIQRAIWSLNERMGTNLVYRGVTDADPNCVAAERTITIRTLPKAEWDAVAAGGGFKPHTLAGFAGLCHQELSPPASVSNPFRGFIIGLSPYDTYTNPQEDVIAHEILHTMGAGHSSEVHTLMHAQVYGNGLFDGLKGFRPAITAADYEDMAARNYMGLALSFDACYAELTPEMHLVHPDVNGALVKLRYVGVIGGNHTWEKQALISGAGYGCTDVQTDGSGTVYLNDVRTMGLMGTTHYSATLEYIGTVDGRDRWRLTEVLEGGAA